MDKTDALKQAAKHFGANLAGIAELEPLRKGLPLVPEDLLVPYRFAIVLGIRLDDAIVDEITDKPTPRYAQHYKDVNAALDSASEKLVAWLSNKGFKALTIPASRIMDDKKFLGSISHKAVARLAGLGWQGKSLLIVNPDCGPRFRMATVLTDMPLTPDKPIKNHCGNCTACTDACPPKAIKNVSTETHYKDRDEAIDFAKCLAHCLSFKADPAIGASVCGVCVMVCPWGNKK